MAPERDLADGMEQPVKKTSPPPGDISPIGEPSKPPDTSEEPNGAPKKSAAPASATEKSATALGDYKLLKKLGQGGMGTVYKAEHIGTGNIVALKVLSKELVSKGNYVQRFQQEARAMQKLDHPNVLRCLDVGQAKGFHFLAMELVDGGSVEGWLKELGKFSVGDALHVIVKVCEALQHAHEKSLIHRDIKPDNILLTKDGVIKVADLGLAKDTEEDVSLTKTGAGAGTPIYMAPEQAHDVKHVDVRVDIYAIGVMMYVLLTGRAPFEGTTFVELITAKEKGKFDPMRKHNIEVPSKLDLIVDKMIAKNPKFRHASCQEVIDALRPLGLQNKRLSFLEPEADQTVSARETKPELAKKTQKPADKGIAKTYAPRSTAQKTSVREVEEVSEPGVWYWKFVTPQGKMLPKKVTTEQLRTLIKAGHLDQQAEISKTPKTGFRNAGTFSEFQGAFKSRETVTKAKVKGGRGRDRMKEFEEEEVSRRRWNWVSQSLKGAGNTLFGLFWIVLILCVIGLGGYFAWPYLFGGQ